MSSVSLVWVTPDAENVVGYCARVSSPENQGKDATRLLSYCARHGHWSVFEMASMCIEIKTSRAISAQIIRHKSFSFQEKSQRYSLVNEIKEYPARRQDPESKQSSIDDLSPETTEWFLESQRTLASLSKDLYSQAIEKGIAKECARFLLPMSSMTEIYMCGNLRSWIHYLQQRTTPETQLEHRLIALEIKEIFRQQFPRIYTAMFDQQ